ncbi:acyltransferase [Burkholderiaceae bacterium DAT-1]|nr:acyltransferase [Burkholderiaceae bacterium DAT-1]
MRGPSIDARGIRMGDQVKIFPFVRFVTGSFSENILADIHIGHRVAINAGAYLSGEGGLCIGDDVLIAPHVRILSAGHEIHQGSPIVAHNPLTYGAISIKDGAWIGAGATVLQGVTIGKGAVVGAGAVVTRDVPDMAIVIGNPARIYGYRGERPRGWRKLLSLLPFGKK